MKTGTSGLLCVACVSIMSVALAAEQDIAPPAPVRVELHSKVLNEDRVVWVRTPRDYAEGSGVYPVLYLTDGDGHINEIGSTIDFLAANDRAPEMIVVGIANIDRTHDLTPTHLDQVEGVSTSLKTSGGGDAFLKFIESELVPQIEKKYRTAPFRVLAGHSFGGLFAVHALFIRPDAFNAYIAVSPSLWWDERSEIRRAEAFLGKRKAPLKVTLFFSGAAEGPKMRADYEKLRQVLMTANPPQDFEWGSILLEDEDHGSTVLRAHYAALRKVFAEYPVPYDTATHLAIGGMAGIEDHFRELSRRYGYTIAVPERSIDRLGYGYLFSTPPRTAEAIAVFERYVSLYPDTPNAYDSLADAHEKAGQLEAARKDFEKAVALAKEKKDPEVKAYQKHLDDFVARLPAAPAEKSHGAEVPAASSRPDHARP
jgi:predicted alpha/beta superfamily hydrolase